MVVRYLGKSVAVVASEGAGHSGQTSSSAVGLRPLSFLEAESEVDPSRSADGVHGADCDAGSVFAADAGRIRCILRVGGALAGGFGGGLGAESDDSSIGEPETSFGVDSKTHTRPLAPAQKLAELNYREDQV